ncbi:MAG: hypothetical protein R2793_07260 [Flavobacteriaceae bacterium]
MKRIALLSLLFISVSAFSQESPSGTPKIAIKIEEGATVVLQGVSITFAAVLEDSRCPKYTNCIWAGRAVVEVEVSGEGVTETKKIYLGETRPNEPTGKTMYEKDNYAIEVAALQPYPEEGKEKAPYVLLIAERK